jgi:SP family xylose:H+ symportor-like MFS transporter
MTLANKANLLVTRLTLIAALGGLMFGYDTAVISGAVESIDAYFITPQQLSETLRNTLSGATISSAIFGCVLGAAAAGWIAHRYGRQRALCLAAILFIVSALGAAVPELGIGPIGSVGPQSLWAFIGYRVLGGIGIGLASMVSPLYIAEIAPPALRGRLVSGNQMAIVVGIVLVYFVNWSIARQGDEAWVHAVGWRLMLASAALPAALLLVLLLRVPDSPRWLVLQGREEEAARLLERLDPGGAMQGLQEIRASLIEVDRPLRAYGSRVLITGILLSVLQQAVGINAVLYYAPLLFRNLGASGQSALLQTVLVGAVNLVATVVAMATVDQWGRKPLLVLGGAVMALSMVVLGTCFWFSSLGVAALLSVLCYTAGFALSWGPVTWVLLAEIFPNSIKHRAMPIAVAAQWIANLLVTWSFKMMDGSTVLSQNFNHGFAYWCYAAVSTLSVLFVLRLVPETRGRSLESIEGLWQAEGAGTKVVSGATGVQPLPIGEGEPPRI